MDFIESIVSQLGVDQGQAKALAGTLLGGVQGVLQDKDERGAADQLAAAVPELSDWKTQAASALGDGGGGMLGGLAGALGGGGGGGLLGGAVDALQGASQIAGLAAMLEKFGLDASKASMLAPLAVNFLKTRVDPALLQKILTYAPMLAGAVSGDGQEGGVMGALGGFFKTS